VLDSRSIPFSCDSSSRVLIFILGTVLMISGPTLIGENIFVADCIIGVVLISLPILLYTFKRRKFATREG